MPTAKILVVDDDADTVTTITDWLSRKGYAVIAGTTGEEALRLAAEDRPDLALPQNPPFGRYTHNAPL